MVTEGLVQWFEGTRNQKGLYFEIFHIRDQNQQKIPHHKVSIIPTRSRSFS